MPEPEPEPAELPILRELRADLDRAFHACEQRAAVVVAPRKRRRPMLPTGALAAAAAAAGVLALISGLDSADPGPDTAAAALGQAAVVAEHRAAPLPRDDQFFFVRSRHTGIVSSGPPGQPKTATALVTKERAIWTSITRRGRLQERVVATRFPTRRHRRAWERAGRPSLAIPPATGDGESVTPRGTYRLGPLRLTRQQLVDFPTDPGDIYARLRSRVPDRGRSPAFAVFTALGAALRESPAPAELRAGLYRAIALVPGVKLVGRVTDSAGRQGTAVALAVGRGVRRELVFDARTSELLAEREVLVDPGAVPALDLPAGTAIGESVYLQRGVTDELTAP